MILQGDKLPLGDLTSVIREVLEQVVVVGCHSEPKRSVGEESSSLNRRVALPGMRFFVAVLHRMTSVQLNCFMEAISMRNIIGISPSPLRGSVEMTK